MHCGQSYGSKAQFHKINETNYSIIINTNSSLYQSDFIYAKQKQQHIGFNSWLVKIYSFNRKTLSIYIITCVASSVAAQIPFLTEA